MSEQKNPAASEWTVSPDETTIDLVFKKADGTEKPFWIKVKNYLTVGEDRRVATAGWRGMSGGKKSADNPDPSAEISVDWRAQTFARSIAYLLAWSLEKDGVPMTRDGIESLKPEVYQVVEDAITAHREAMEAAKKVPAGKDAPSTMSA